MSINYKTIDFISVIYRLQNKLKNGVINFKECQHKDFHNHLIVCEGNEGIRDGYLDIVWDACLDELHHDIICVYSDQFEKTTIEYDTKTGSIEINSYDESSIYTKECPFTIIIEKDNWYVC